MHYLDHREAVILIGNPGTGKTHVATALGVEACGRGKRVQFWKVTELITHLIEAREERQLARMKKQLARLDLLILDELGYVPTSKLGAELLFDVISTAYERNASIVTTNLPFENWTEVLGSERLTGALGSADPSLSHPGGDRRELSTSGRTPPASGRGDCTNKDRTHLTRRHNHCNPAPFLRRRRWQKCFHYP